MALQIIHLTYLLQSVEIGHMNYLETAMNYLTKSYPVAVVTNATGVPYASIQNSLNRGHVVGHRDADIVGGGMKGKARLFSFNAVMQIAIANALINSNSGDVKQAFATAAAIAYTSYSSDGAPRLAGLPFPLTKGDTLLFVAGNRSQLRATLDGNVNLEEVATSLGKPTGFVVVNLTNLFLEVVGQLGIPEGQKALDEAYGI
jgi:hypothetical protein